MVFDEPIKEIDHLKWQQLRFVLDKINGQFISFDEAKLLYSGRRSGFAPCAYGFDVHDKPDTICLVRSKAGKISGAYTNIPWTEDGEDHKDAGKTFLFNVKREKMTKYPHMPDDLSQMYKDEEEDWTPEVIHKGVFEGLFHVGNNYLSW